MGCCSSGRARSRSPHPLIRAVVVASAEPAERRAVHAALAEALHDPADADRRAWHLAAAVIGQDADIAALLDEAAGRVAARGGREYEARLLERSADLTPDRDLRATRRVRAARAHRGAGDLAAASRALDRATEDTSNAAAIGVILSERARLLGAGGDSDQAVALLVEHARRLDGAADGVARHMRLLAAQELLAVGRPGDARDVLGEAPADEDDGQARFTMARVLLETGRRPRRGRPDGDRPGEVEPGSAPRRRGGRAADRGRQHRGRTLRLALGRAPAARSRRPDGARGRAPDRQPHRTDPRQAPRGRLGRRRGRADRARTPARPGAGRRPHADRAVQGDPRQSLPPPVSSIPQSRRHAPPGCGTSRRPASPGTVGSRC